MPDAVSLPLPKPHNAFITERGLPAALAIQARRGKPPTGSAILSGKLSGPIPLNATIRILYRPEAGALGDGVLVAMVPVDATGSWQVSGLKADLKYDVVARREGYNDVITANVSPVAI